MTGWEFKESKVQRDGDAALWSSVTIASKLKLLGKQNHLLHMQTIGMASEVPILLPVRQLNPDWVATFLVDNLGDELRGRYVDHIKGAEPGAPDGPINVSLNAL